MYSHRYIKSTATYGEVPLKNSKIWYVTNPLHQANEGETTYKQVGISETQSLCKSYP